MKPKLAVVVVRLFAMFSVFIALTCIVTCRMYEVDSEIPTEDNGFLPANLAGNVRMVDLVGQVFDEAGNPLAGVIVREGYGSQSVQTDNHGFFRLLNITGYENIALVKVSKPGYFDGSRSFVPSDGQSHLRIVMKTLSPAQTFNSGTGGTVNQGLVSIEFTSGSIAYGGQPYSGNVNVIINNIDPSDTWATSQQMPGSLLGSDSIDLDLPDGFAVLQSFGMAGVGLLGSNDQELSLSAGNSATLGFEIPSSLLSLAPSTIPLWYYNENYGFWIRDGEATKNGNFYIGTITRTGFWNCAIPHEAFKLKLTLNDQANGATPIPIEGAHVVITSAASCMVNGFSDSNGLVSCLVPANEELEMKMNLVCDNQQSEIYSQGIGPFTSNQSLIIAITDIPAVASIQGEFLNAVGTPIPGYIFLGTDARAGFVSTTNGSFRFLTCPSNNQEVSGWFYAGSLSCNSPLQTIDLVSGVNQITVSLQNCGQPGAGGIDQDGNPFTSVLIGSQEWMNMNLSVATYADGTLIPQVNNPSEWANLTTGAWCWYNYNSANGTTYGRLYNWYAVNDPRGLAPEGWHIPSESEWNSLINFLDPYASGGSAIPNTAGGMMKTIGTMDGGNGFWQQPNTGANNICGFSGIPGGFVGSNGVFSNIGIHGEWWSSTELSENDDKAWTRNLQHISNSTYRDNYSKKFGFSVRCVRD